MDADELEQLLIKFNDTRRDYPRGVLPFQLVESLAERCPDIPAVVDESASLSYREFNALANRLARRLLDAGFGKGRAVAVSLPRSPLALAVFLAAHKAGMAYVYLDPQYPRTRVEDILADLAPVVVVTVPGAADNLPGGVETLDASGLADGPDPGSPAVAVSGSDPAYYIFTSGTTGRPKGIRVRQENLANLVFWCQDYYDIEVGEVATQMARLTFDTSVWEIWSNLCAGATLWLMPEEVRQDITLIPGWLSRVNARHCMFSTALAERLMCLDMGGNPQLRHFNVGGERLKTRPPVGFPALVVNQYGPSEGTVVATAAVVEAEGESAPGIGKPIANCQIYILDPQLRPVPLGEEGELCIGGAQVSDGYVGNPELNRACFVPNPFLDYLRGRGARCSDVIYRTGDLGRWTPAGELEYVGRRDLQVKLRGFRIELSEIEAALAAHPAVATAAVQKVGEALVAFVVPGGEVEAEALRSHLEARLPDYMVPARFHFLERLPLTVHNKVDRAKLLELGAAPRPGRAAAPLEGRTQRLVAEAWTVQAGLPRDLAANDNFLELGGHSITAALVCAALSKRLQVALRPVELLRSADLRDFAALVDSKASEGEDGRQVVRLPGPRLSFPASSPQRGTWMGESASASGSLYNITTVYHVDGPLDARRFLDALREVLGRHEAFRTAFAVKDNALCQELAPSVAFDLPFQDLSASPDCFDSTLESLGNTRFDLSVPPLFRGCLVRLGPESHKLLWVIHHSIFDGWSAAIFLRELYAAYQGRLRPFAGDEPDYPDFAVWQQRRMAAAQDDIEYWTKRLAGVVWPLPLPFDRPRPPGVPSGDGARVAFVFDSELTAGLRRLAESRRGSLFCVLQTLFQTLLHKYAPAKRVVTGTVAANRDVPGTQDIVGAFINTLILANDFDGDPSFSELLGRMTDTVYDAVTRQETPFEAVARALGFKGIQRWNPVFQVSSLLQDLPWPSGAPDGWNVRCEEVGNHKSRLDLFLMFESCCAGLDAWVEYSSDLFDAATVETMGRNLVALARQVVDNPERRLSELQAPELYPCERKPSCVLIGETTLMRQCAEALAAAGMRVDRVLSDDPAVLDWARGEGINAIAPRGKAAIRPFLAAKPYDYLFSVVNKYQLDQATLDSCGRCAVNYHDSLLPAYAGVNSTSWAIINQESAHGVTWHVMTAALDSGGILKRRTVDIVPDDTAFTLNAKCYEAAVETFRELVAELAAGQVQPEAQDLSRRSYYPLRARPGNACVLDWEQGAERLAALVRGLDFGHYPNPLGIPKLFLGEGFALCPQAEASLVKSTLPPGTVAAVDGGILAVATSTNDLTLGPLADVDGRSTTLGLAVSARLPALGERRAQALDAAYKALSPKEDFWLARLACVAPLALPLLAGHEGQGRGLLELNLPPMEVETLLVAYAAFLSKLGDSEDFDLGLRHVAPEGAEALFAAYVPWRVHAPAGEGFVRPRLLADLARLREHGGYCRDIFLRHPELRSSVRPAYRCGVSLAADLGPNPPPLTLVALPGLASLSVDFAVIARSEAEDFARRLALFLANLAENPGRPLASVPLLSAVERHRELVEWNDTAVDFGIDRPYHACFSAQAARTPEAVAAKFLGEPLTFAELDVRSNQLARHLQRHGAGEGDVVAFALERSLAVPIAILGIMKAGAAYLPLDINYPAERLLHMLRDSRAKSLVSDSAVLGRLGLKPGHAVLLDMERDEIAGEEGGPLPVTTSPDSLAYVIYTSGSTGQPKGVEITHRNLLNHNHAAIRAFGFGPDDVFAQCAALSFDISVEELFPAWLLGRPVVFRPAGALGSIQAFFAFVRAEGVTVLDLPTAFWHELVLALESIPLPDCIRTVVVGGEKASPERFALWRKLAPKGVRLFDSYGPTETTVIATSCELDGSDMSIGKPLANVKAYVLDRHLFPVPPGSAGELYLGGDCVGRGYLGNPGLTARSFLPDPFAAKGRVYKTGDLVERRMDGALVFVGRVDNQVKLRGFRVELDGVKAALEERHDIKDAVVVVREDVPGTRRLAAYYVASGGHDLDAKELHQHLSHSLPDYMLPSSFTRLDAFPMTPAGKLDLKALPEPRESQGVSVDGYVPPCTPEQQTICNIFRDVLGGRQVGIRDNFFELGGDSLMTIRVIDKLHKAGLELSVEQLFKRPTAEHLSELAQATFVVPPPGEPPCLVELHRGAPGFPALFLAHTPPGDLLGYVNLVQCLDKRLPVYGFQSVGLSDKDACHTSIEAMAAYYIGVMRRHQPQGPYLLGGWCLGGTIAFEMARQLCGNGVPVALLAVFDSTGYPPRGLALAYHMERIGSLLRMGPGALCQFLADKIRGDYDADQDNEGDGLFKDIGMFANRSLVRRANVAALRLYHSRPYPGKVTVFKASANDGYLDSPTLRWETIAAEVEVFVTPGEHGTQLKPPHVQALADALMDCVRGACPQAFSPGAH